MKERRIVAFTKDWDDVPTCTTHILREMGKEIAVLWVNSIGTRKPSLRHPSHIRRIVKRLAGGFKRAELKENKLRVLSPLLIPKAQGRFTLWLNKKFFAWQAGRELRDMGSGVVEYWCFVPNAVDLVPLKNNIKVVYYCVDDWTKFHYLDTSWITKKEYDLLKRADFIFAVSKFLCRKLEKVSLKKVYYLPHGVEYNKFKQALNITILPDDIKSIKKPIIGFYGNIYPWVNLKLILEIAKVKPCWSFVMIGEVFDDISMFNDIDNVHFIGRKEHDQLPEYCAAFDVAIIPYDMDNKRMESVSPVKVKELLAAGVPVVSADVPELLGMDDVTIASSVGEWVDSIERQLKRKDSAIISYRLKSYDWQIKVREIRDIIL